MSPFVGAKAPLASDLVVTSRFGEVDAISGLPVVAPDLTTVSAVATSGSNNYSDAGAGAGETLYLLNVSGAVNTVARSAAAPRIPPRAASTRRASSSAGRARSLGSGTSSLGRRAKARAKAHASTTTCDGWRNIETMAGGSSPASFST